MGLLVKMLSHGSITNDPGCHPDVAATAPRELFHILEQYSVYRSVLRALSKAIRKADCVTEENSGPFWGRWVEFQQVVAERQNYRSEFDELHAAGAAPGFHDCQYIKVS